MSTIPDQPVTLKDGRAALIRTGRPSDSSACVRFMEHVLAESDHLLLEPGEFEMTVEQERAWLKERLDGFAKLVIVAEAGGEVIAICNFEGNDKRKRISHTGVLGISIRKAWRNAGLGRAILQTLIGWATAHPAIERLSLTVFAGNPHAIELYKSFGFTEEARLPRSIKLAPGRYADELIMARWVK